MRKRIDYKPYITSIRDNEIPPWEITGHWPGSWICCRNVGDVPFVAAYKLEFEIEKEIIITAHVSADERYELYLDGVRIGRGSERGDQNNWYFETYELNLKKGNHVIVARAWSLRKLKPLGQVSVYPGFIFSPEGEENIEMLATGVAKWQAKELKGYSFVDSVIKGVVTGAELFIDGNKFSWGFEKGEGIGWDDVIILDKGYGGTNMNIASGVHVMKPAVIPPMIERKITAGSTRFFEYITTENVEEKAVNEGNDVISEKIKWNKLLQGDSIKVPPKKSLRLIIDLENYYCAYPEIIVSGGKDSIMYLNWSEALYDKDEKFALLNDGRINKVKKNRNDIEGKTFSGVGDTFKLNGGDCCKYQTLWWHAGRYVEIIIKTEKEMLTINNLNFYETRYPLEMESSFYCDDERINNLVPILFRSLQECCHETYMDCPYWEQLMYIGDTRLQALVNYVASSDDLLQRKALQIIDSSRFSLAGLINCAYPQDGGKVIPSFCLWWAAMVYDYALWKGDKQFVQNLMPGVRSVIDTFIKNRNSEGLIKQPEGWNFIDWAIDSNKKWSFGVPPEDGAGINSIFNFQMVYILNLTSELEAYLGEPELALRAKRFASELKDKIIMSFWNEEKGLFADDLKHQCFSEHAQCMAVLSNSTNGNMKMKIAKSMINNKDLARTSIFFRHYLFEAYEELKLENKFYDNLADWFNLEDLGLKTTPEIFSEQARSDCHGWGAHPLYHFFTYTLGIRPNEMGFKSVLVSPHLGYLKQAFGTMLHAKGKISVEYKVYEDCIKAEIILPGTLSGKFVFKDTHIELKPGRNEITLFR